MALILKLDLDMVKMYLHTKNEVSMSSSSKVIAWTDRHTDRQTHRQTDTQTDRHTDRQTHRHDRKHYLPAYAGGKKKDSVKPALMYRNSEWLKHLPKGQNKCATLLGAFANQLEPPGADICVPEQLGTIRVQRIMSSVQCKNSVRIPVVYFLS